MLTLLRENTHTARVLRAIHLGQVHRRPEDVKAEDRPGILAGTFLPGMGWPQDGEAPVGAALVPVAPTVSPRNALVFARRASAVPLAAEAPAVCDFPLHGELPISAGAAVQARPAGAAPRRARGMVLRPPTGRRSALVQGRGARHLLLVEAATP